MRIEEYQQNQFRVVTDSGNVLGTINEIGGYEFVKNGRDPYLCDQAYFAWLGFMNDPENYEVKSMIYGYREFMHGLNTWSADECMTKIFDDYEDEEFTEYFFKDDEYIYAGQ